MSLEPSYEATAAPIGKWAAASLMAGTSTPEVPAQQLEAAWQRQVPRFLQGPVQARGPPGATMVAVLRLGWSRP
eukprot:11181699-Lingulodinium_polyedra.AAC.1